jgi:uncharacterized protein
MKIAIDQIVDTPKALHYLEDADPLNAELRKGAGDYEVPQALAVDLDYYRAGLDVYFGGRVHGAARGHCARCLEEFPVPLDVEVSLVLTPRNAADLEGGELGDGDLGLGFYEGEEIDVTALVHEQTILALPSRALCSEDCRGLCPRCGANRNTTACSCDTDADDGPLGVLRTLVRRG